MRALGEIHPLDVAVARLRGWAYHDSLVNLDKHELRAKLAADVAATGTDLMTEEESMTFICGGDEGEPPPELVKRFPATHEWIGRHW